MDRQLRPNKRWKSIKCFFIKMPSWNTYFENFKHINLFNGHFKPQIEGSQNLTCSNTWTIKIRLPLIASQLSSDCLKGLKQKLLPSSLELLQYLDGKEFKVYYYCTEVKTKILLIINWQCLNQQLSRANKGKIILNSRYTSFKFK